MVWERNRGSVPVSDGAAREVLAGEMAGLIALTCATEFGKSFEPIVPMIRVRGDALQVTIAMGRFSGHGNFATIDADRRRAKRARMAGSGSGGWPQPPRKKRVGAMPEESGPAPLPVVWN
jgi:hypothetical protein